MELVASSFRDVYEVADALTGMAIKATGREYPDGLLRLDEEKSEKLARSLVQINNSLPALAERVNKVSAPLTFFTILLSDLAVKGALVYGLVKNQPVRPGIQAAADRS